MSYVEGKFQLKESENFEDFMKALGVSYLVRKLGNKSSPWFPYRKLAMSTPWNKKVWLKQPNSSSKWGSLSRSWLLTAGRWWVLWRRRLPTPSCTKCSAPMGAKILSASGSLCLSDSRWSARWMTSSLLAGTIGSSSRIQGSSGNPSSDSRCSRQYLSTQYFILVFGTVISNIRIWVVFTVDWDHKLGLSVVLKSCSTE